MAGAAGGPATALDAIFEARIPAEACRALAMHAVEVALRRPCDSRAWQASQQPIPLVEEILALVGRAMGESAKASITRCKKWLRERGLDGAQLASRISRLSKVRNAHAHPDVGILDEVRRVLAAAAGGAAAQDPGNGGVTEQARSDQSQVDLPDAPGAGSVQSRTAQDETSRAGVQADVCHPGLAITSAALVADGAAELGPMHFGCEEGLCPICNAQAQFAGGGGSARSGDQPHEQICSRGEASRFALRSDADVPEAEAPRPPPVRVRSASGTNSSGEIRPRSGCCQRISASKPARRPDARSTMGW